MKATPIPSDARRAVRERLAGKCLRCGMGSPNGQWHHRRSRSVRDQWTHSPVNGVWLCRTCHQWVHAHPFEARSHGFIVSRAVESPMLEPVYSYAGWMYLNADGSFIFQQG